MRKKAPAVINALDRPDLPMLAMETDHSVLSDPSVLPDPAAAIDSAIAPIFEGYGLEEPTPEVIDGGAIWEEVKKYLTDREFHIFELRYRYQYRQTDIVRITGLLDAAVSRHLSKARNKLCKAFEGRQNSKEMP